MVSRGGAGRRRWLWRGIAVAVLGVLAMFPLANLVLMLPAAKTRVEAKMAAVTGSPVTAGSIRYWPWSGLVLREVGVAEGGRLPGTLTVDEITVEVEVGSVFSSEIEVPVVRLVRPRAEVVWKQVTPVVVAAVGQAEAAESPPAEVPVPVPEAAVANADEGATAAGGGAAGEATGRGPRAERGAPGRRLILGLIEVREGRASVSFGGQKLPLLEVEGIDLVSDFSSVGSGGSAGTLRVESLVLGGGVRAGPVAGGLVRDGGVVTVPDLVAEVGGGRLEGELKVAPWGAGMPFEASLKAVEIDLSELLGEGVEGFLFSGVLGGEAKVSGYGTVAETWRGEGGFRIAEMGVTGGGAEVVLEPTEVSGTLEGGWIQLRRFYAHSDELVLRASGGGVLDGRLGVNLRVYVDQSTAAAVARRLEVLGGGRPSGMHELEGTHYAFRDVAVRGTIGDPALVLWDDQAPVRPGDFLRCFTPDGAVEEPFLAQ